ncbi:unnamed protein product [Zymoseptoria tritici ST99CH_3D7]|uniref:Uncharacterized protein n=2 Tax=Zymoseptoria tritici TaxID=1047171 RepID=A0A1X7RL00_ZYMT9|nr:unnamed protein product [Zymoseptoria tritici ST99CH_3D7]SMR46659.1 unnamed protein product [Zymoseptoria tritici ST99CH_1E4]
MKAVLVVYTVLLAAAHALPTLWEIETPKGTRQYCANSPGTVRYPDKIVTDHCRSLTKAPVLENITGFYLGLSGKRYNDGDC